MPSPTAGPGTVLHCDGRQGGTLIATPPFEVAVFETVLKGELNTEPKFFYFYG